MKRDALRTAAAGLLGVGLLAASSPTATQAPSSLPGQDLEPRVKALEDEIETVRGQLEEMQQAKAQLEAFLAAQARSADALRASLATSEDEGFTAGINPKSREVLLAGFRSYLDTLEAAAPKEKTKKKAKDGDPADGKSAGGNEAR